MQQHLKYVKDFEEPVLLINENSDEPKYFKHYCDDYVTLHQYKKDRTFNEMRRDVYFKTYYDSFGHSYNTMLKEYTNTKNELKETNMKMNYLFVDNKKHEIINLVIDFDILHVKETPKAFEKLVTNGRIIDYNGNSKIALFCDDAYFYVLDWGGS
jgi:hypothetical protein